jgi:hypothetical protein
MASVEWEPLDAKFKLVSLPLVRTKQVRRKWADEEGDVTGPIDDEDD